MPALRLKTFSKPLLVLLSLLLLWWLAMGWLLPRLLLSQAPRWLTDKTGYQLTLDRPAFRPFQLRLSIEHLQLRDPAGAELLSFRQLEVDLAAASLWQRALVFDDIQLNGLVARLAFDQTGQFNWTPFVAALKNPDEPPSAGWPRLLMHRLGVHGGKLVFEDARRDFTSHIQPLDFALEDVSTLGSQAQPGEFKLTARSGDDAQGAELLWQGRLHLLPAGVADLQGRLTLNRLQLARLAPYLASALPQLQPEGRLTLSLDYHLHHDQENTALDLKQIQARLDAFSLTAKQADTRLQIREIAASNGQFDLQQGALTLEQLSFREVGLHWPAAAPLSLGQLTLQAIKLDLHAQTAQLDAIRLQDGQLALRRHARGQLDLPQAFARLQTALQPTADHGPKPAPVAVPAAAAESAEAGTAAASDQATPAAWQVHLGQFELAGFNLDFQDQTLQPAGELQLRNLRLQASDLSADLERPVPLNARLDFAAGGQLALQGTLIPATGLGELQIQLQQLNLQPAQPWLAQLARLRLQQGQLDVTGKLQLTAQGPQFLGGLALQDLRLLEAAGHQPFLTLTKLATSAAAGGLKASAQGVDIATLTLDGLDTRLHIAADKTLNLNELLVNRASSDESATNAQRSPHGLASAKTLARPVEKNTAAPSAEFVFNLDRLRLRKTLLDFADLSLALPFATRIHNLRGSITGLSNQPGRLARLALDGEVDDYGLARISGQLDLRQPTSDTDVQVKFRNVEMRSLTPYTATFAGRRIESGKLSLDLGYRIKNRQLVGDNKVVMERLTLGERVTSPQARDLPLDLAIAILEDADGRIDLGLPVAGSLDDPQFSYGSIIWQAIANVFSKVVTAPFRLLGKLLGGSDERLDEIRFEAGAPDLSPPEREKLARLAQALQQRPNLGLSLAGRANETDRQRLQLRQLRLTVARRLKQQIKADEDPGPLSLENPKVQAVLNALHEETLGKENHARLQSVFRQANPGQLPESLTTRLLTKLQPADEALPEAEIAALKGKNFHAVLQQQLREHQDISTQRLQQLAQQRAEQVRQRLIAAGVAADRLKLGKTEVLTDTETEIPLHLELQALPAHAAVPDTPNHTGPQPITTPD